MIKELYCVEIGERTNNQREPIMATTFNDLQEAIRWGKDELKFNGGYCVIWKQEVEEFEANFWDDKQKLIMFLETDAFGDVRVVV